MTARILATLAAVAAALAATSAGAAGMDLSQDIQAKGTTPDWSLKVSHGTQLTLTRPGKPVLKATAPGAAISPAGASLTGKTAGGQQMIVTLQSKPCALGGSELPMTAQVTLGADILSGCAGPAR